MSTPPAATAEARRSPPPTERTKYWHLSAHARAKTRLSAAFSYAKPLSAAAAQAPKARRAANKCRINGSFDLRAVYRRVPRCMRTLELRERLPEYALEAFAWAENLDDSAIRL
jgi:hypothetical protein